MIRASKIICTVYYILITHTDMHTQYTHDRQVIKPFEYSGVKNERLLVSVLWKCEVLCRVYVFTLYM